MKPLGVGHDRLKAREVGRLDEPALREAGHRALDAAVDEALRPEQDRDRDQEAGVKRNEGAARRAEDQRQQERRYVPDQGQRQRAWQNPVAAARQVGCPLQLEQRVAVDQREAAPAQRLRSVAREDRSLHLEEGEIAAAPGGLGLRLKFAPREADVPSETA